MISFIIIAIYFLVSWITPWDKLVILDHVSTSYLWDLIFSVSILLLFKLEFIKIKKTYFQLILRFLFVIILGFLSVQIIFQLGIKTPFRFIEDPFIQLLIMAPIFEELVFRSAIQGRLSQEFGNKKWIILVSASLFSLSHLSALWFLPPSFHSFIYCQLIYTFILGWILAKSHDRGIKTFEPIFLHFVFNIFFLP